MRRCGNDGAVPAALVDGPALVSTGAEAIRHLVVGYVPEDAREERSKQRFLAELDRLEAPCDREADPVHVTASAIVVGRRGSVLHVHRRLGRWLQPGGHVDSGEDPAQAAVRETREETGLAACHPPGGPELVHLDVHQASGHVHMDLRYLLVAPDEEPAPGTGESPHVRWFPWEEAVAVADEALVGGLRRAKQRWEALEACEAPPRGVGRAPTSKEVAPDVQ